MTVFEVEYAVNGVTAAEPLKLLADGTPVTVEGLKHGDFITFTELTPPVVDGVTWGVLPEIASITLDAQSTEIQSVTVSNTAERTLGSYTVAKASDPVSGSTVMPGDTIRYTVTVTPGEVGFVDDVVVTDDLSQVLASAALVEGSISASQGTASLAGNTLTWQVGTVSSANGPLVITYDVVVDEDAWGVTLRNVVTADGEEPPEECTTCSTEHYTPAWTVTKTADPASGSEVDPGDYITYTLTVNNTGPVDLSGAVVTDDASEVFAYAVLGGALPEGLTRSGDTLTWAVPDVAVGESVSVSYRVRVDDDASDVELVNVVAPASDGGQCTPDGCETTHIVPQQEEMPATGADVAGTAGAAALMVLSGIGLAYAGRRARRRIA